MRHATGRDDRRRMGRTPDPLVYRSEIAVVVPCKLEHYSRNGTAHHFKCVNQHPNDAHHSTTTRWRLLIIYALLVRGGELAAKLPIYGTACCT